MTGHDSSPEQPQRVDLETELRGMYGDVSNLTADDLRDRARARGYDLPSYLDKEEVIVALAGGGFQRRTG